MVDWIRHFRGVASSAQPQRATGTQKPGSPNPCGAKHQYAKQSWPSCYAGVPFSQAPCDREKHNLSTIEGKVDHDNVVYNFKCLVNNKSMTCDIQLALTTAK